MDLHRPMLCHHPIMFQGDPAVIWEITSLLLYLASVVVYYRVYRGLQSEFSSHRVREGEGQTKVNGERSHQSFALSSSFSLSLWEDGRRPLVQCSLPVTISRYSIEKFVRAAKHTQDNPSLLITVQFAAGFPVNTALSMNAIVYYTTRRVIEKAIE